MPSYNFCDIRTKRADLSTILDGEQLSKSHLGKTYTDSKFTHWHPEYTTIESKIVQENGSCGLVKR